MIRMQSGRLVDCTRIEVCAGDVRPSDVLHDDYGFHEVSEVDYKLVGDRRLVFVYEPRPNGGAIAHLLSDRTLVVVFRPIVRGEPRA